MFTTLHFHHFLNVLIRLCGILTQQHLTQMHNYTQLIADYHCLYIFTILTIHFYEFNQLVNGTPFNDF